MSTFKTTPEQKVRLYEIASLMKKEGLADSFIADAVEIGLYYEGVYDLFELWAEEDDLEEKGQIVSDLQEEIDEYKEQPKMLLNWKIKSKCGQSNTEEFTRSCDFMLQTTAQFAKMLGKYLQRRNDYYL